MNCRDASAPVWTSSKERAFRAKVASVPIGDCEVKASLVEARMGKILGLLELVPPVAATEGAFRLVRQEVLGFHSDMVWLRKHASEAGNAGGEPLPSEARVAAKQSSSMKRSELPRPFAEGEGGPEATSSLKTYAHSRFGALAGSWPHGPVDFEGEPISLQRGEEELCSHVAGDPVPGWLESPVNRKSLTRRSPFLWMRFYMTYIVLSYIHSPGGEPLPSL
jgi:hypothetical protein